MVRFICLGPPTFGEWTVTDMALLHIPTLKLPSADTADSANLSLVNFFHMPNVAIFHDNARASFPDTSDFLQAIHHNGEAQMLVRAAQRAGGGLSLMAHACLGYN